MPSDTSGRFPIGVLARPAPDFFDDNLATAAYTAPIVHVGAGNGWGCVALFNNATDGRAFKVYGATVNFDGGEGAWYFFIYGTTGSLVANAAAIRPDLGAPFGQVFAQQDFSAATSNPFGTGPFAGGLGTNGFDCGTYLSPFPIAVIPAGYSMVIVNPFASCLNFGASWWYQQANE